MRLLFHSLLERDEGEEDWEGRSFETGCPRSRDGGKTLELEGKEGWGVLKIRQFSWTSYVYRPLLNVNKPLVLCALVQIYKTNL